MSKLKKSVDISSIDTMLEKKDKQVILDYCLKNSAEFAKLEKIFDFCKAEIIKPSIPNVDGKYYKKGFSVTVSTVKAHTVKSYRKKAVYFD